MRIVSAPLENLFIYCLEGRYPVGYDGFRENFIGNWQEAESAFLFFNRPADADVERLLQEHRHLRHVDSYRMPYQDWLGGRFDTFQHGRIRITPAWKPAAGAPDDPNGEPATVILDPGVVFGSGLHPTTRHCLEALELASRHAPLGRVLDLGTGSGLLALAAARLEAQQVLAVDLNLLAARTTLENVRRNRLQQRILTVQGRAETFIHLPCDLVLANLHYAVMRRLVDSEQLRIHRRLILSGLMRREAKEIATLLSQRSVQILETWHHEGIWFTFLARTHSGAGQTHMNGEKRQVG
jgi:ribosomal protein L11 methyltransferase